MCYSFHLGPVFQVILCLFSGEVNPRLYFAKDGQQYICARLLSIKAMIVKIYGFASYHRRFGVVLLRVRFIAPLWKRLLIVFDIIQLDRRFIDIDAYQLHSHCTQYRECLEMTLITRSNVVLSYILTSLIA